MSDKNQVPVALAEVSKLVRMPVKYDEYSDTYNFPRSKSAVGTHGARINSIVKLALYGKFTGGLDQLSGDFFLTPNISYNGWDKVDMADEIAIYDEQEHDAYKIAVSYADMAPATEALDCNDEQQQSFDDGVVITFNKKALLPGSTIIDGIEGPELVLPQAPSITAIHGIYPVEGNAAIMLNHALEQLRNKVE